MDESSSMILTGYPFGPSGNRLVPLLDQSAGTDSFDLPFCTQDNVNDCIDYINQVVFLCVHNNYTLMYNYVI
jgi:hypothetical protein